MSEIEIGIEIGIPIEITILISIRRIGDTPAQGVSFHL